MFKISVFSKLAQVSCRMLRYYDEMGLLKPAEVDKFSGYRLYAIDQIPRLKKITALRDMGFLVAEIAILLEETDEKHIFSQLQKKREEVFSVIAFENEKLKRLDKMIQSLGTKNLHMNYEIVLKSIPDYLVVSLRKTISTYWNEGDLWKELDAFVKKEKIQSTGFGFAIYHDTDYKDYGIDMEVVMQVHKLGQNKDVFTFRQVNAIPLVASIMITGPFENISLGYQSLAEWLSSSDYELYDTTRQIVHRGPHDESNSENYLIEIQIPVIKK